MKRDALNLAREFYSNPKLRVTEVRLTKLVDFENITEVSGQHKIV